MSREGEAYIKIIATGDISRTDLRLRFAITESNIYWLAPNQSQWHNQTFRDMIPDTTGILLNIAQNDTLDFIQQFSCPEPLDYADCELVAFVQSHHDRDILQGAKISVLDLEYILSAFGLISPADDTVLYTCSPNFIWYHSEDVDSGYEVNYQLYVSADTDFTSPLVFEAAMDTSFQVNSGLQYGQTYYWKVQASNGHAPDRFSDQVYNFICIAAGALSGVIRETDGTTSIEGALVEMLVDGEIMQSRLSGSGGDYLFEHLPEDVYDMRVSRDGYLTQSAEDIEIVLDGTEVRDFELPRVFAYLTGDANMFNEIVEPNNPLTGPRRAGEDVIYLVNYFDAASGNQPCLLHNPNAQADLQYFYASGDITGDCHVLGGDVSRLVRYFSGNPAAIINWCGHNRPNPGNYYIPLWLNNRGSGFPQPVPPLDELPDGWPNCQIEPRPASQNDKMEPAEVR